MTESVGRLGSVSLDCADPLALARFWATVLGGEVAFESDDFCAVKLPGVWISTVRVPEYTAPEWPDGQRAKQIHLDVAVADLDAAERAAVAAGATAAEHQPQPERWRVLLDPAGHPFCVSANIPE
jgi:hypothetical protein